MLLFTVAASDCPVSGDSALVEVEAALRMLSESFLSMETISSSPMILIDACAVTISSA
jgi:hypothetical protein